jgi:hypothetical protein
MIPQLLKILRESIKAVPAMKYALAIAGILGVVAMVGAFKISPAMAAIGAVITLVLMVAMVVFARLTTTAPRYFFLPAQVMMWAFLIVTVGTAFLLFTSAFFHWPRGLRELLDPNPGPAIAAPDRTADTTEIRDLVVAAAQQRKVRDYPGAWATIARAKALQPGAKEVREEERQTAMEWIRNMSVREPATFTETLRPLTEALYRHLAAAKGATAADIHAHLGWANFLRWREGARELKVDDSYIAAVEHDATNPFAQAMWGHWLAVRGRPLSEINPHFQLALKSGRERPFVQNLRVYALLWVETPETTAELLRVADEMRRAGDSLDADLRRRIASAVYSRLGRNDELTVLALLPPGDQLLTFRWLVEGRDLSSDAALAYFRARLTEANGEFDAAATQYRALIAQDTRFDERAKAGLARCEQRGATRR